MDKNRSPLKLRGYDEDELTKRINDWCTPEKGFFLSQRGDFWNGTCRIYWAVLKEDEHESRSSSN